MSHNTSSAKSGGLDRATNGDPVRKDPLFCFWVAFFFVVVVNMQKVTDIDCVQSVTEQEQKQKVRVKWREKGEAAELGANVPICRMNYADHMCFSSLAVKTLPAQFSSL